ncbi:cytochrome c oxidase assembly protein [Mycolicibacterium pyrenivorans]|uniref:cytochrome c oxidase assembly protein n=1 Tax=Mycolicibacterium pyrenivorans TaxID=187102 RepID=UPI0021F38BC4|nr:cytochrome c oxidase assembly protein [Mycolicibacterium pyrenivorans]
MYRLSRRGAPWSTRRTVSWLIGCLALLFATSSGLGMYMAATFSMHAVAQLMLTIVVPVLLVQGAPVTLALKALQAVDPNGVPGPREWLVSALNSSLLRFIAHPWTALTLLVVGVYGLCLKVVFDAAVSEHASHMLMIGYFLLSGALFFTAVGGVEPVPRLMPKRGRIAMLLFALSQFVIAGVVVMNMREVLGGAFYRSLKLSWHADLLSDQRLGGQVIAAGGLVAVMAVIAVQIVPRRRSTAIEQMTTTASLGS